MVNDAVLDSKSQGLAFLALKEGWLCGTAAVLRSGYKMPLQSIENHLFVNQLNAAKGYGKK